MTWFSFDTPATALQLTIAGTSKMQPENQTDHIALLALMMCGALTKRMAELNQLDEETGLHLHRLVQTVRAHARLRNIDDLEVLFGNIDRSLAGEAEHPL